MIGYKKRIIIFYDNKTPTIMINPILLSHSKTQYKTLEGCLSHIGTKETKRYEKIKKRDKNVFIVFQRDIRRFNIHAIVLEYVWNK